MPRKARIDAPGAFHHIIIRGIDRQDIFKDNSDRENFVERIGKNILDTKTGCYAWVLMNNHVHMLLKTGLVPIATIMRRVLTGYAVSFNRRHRRYGHLFQNRYKSFLCEEELYLKELVRYIHLNPLRAGVLKDIRELNRYAWCGHGAIIGLLDIDWQDTDYVLKFFGDRITEARRSYSAFLSKGVKQGKRQDLVGGGLIRSVGGWSELKKYKDMGLRVQSDERILGSSEFVERVLKRADEQLEEKYRLQSANISIEALVETVSQYFDITTEQLRSASKNRTVTRARRILCYIALRKIRFSGAHLSRKIGISPNTACRAAEFGRKIADIDKIQKEILTTFK